MFLSPRLGYVLYLHYRPLNWWGWMDLHHHRSVLARAIESYTTAPYEWPVRESRPRGKAYETLLNTHSTGYEFLLLCVLIA